MACAKKSKGSEKEPTTKSGMKKDMAMDKKKMSKLKK